MQLQPHGIFVEGLHVPVPVQEAKYSENRDGCGGGGDTTMHDAVHETFTWAMLLTEGSRMER